MAAGAQVIALSAGNAMGHNSCSLSRKLPAARLPRPANPAVAELGSVPLGRGVVRERRCDGGVCRGLGAYPRVPAYLRRCSTTAHRVDSFAAATHPLLFTARAWAPAHTRITFRRTLDKPLVQP